MSKIPESKKPRQFWIYKSNLFRNDLIATSLPISFSDRTKVIHVIEYSAYEELQKQNKELIEVLKTRKCDEVLNKDGSGMFNKHDPNCNKCKSLEKFKKVCDEIH